jgi:hypothetical protein
MTKEHFLHSDVRVIRPTKGLRLVDPFELWRWRELFVALMMFDNSGGQTVRTGRQ